MNIALKKIMEVLNKNIIDIISYNKKIVLQNNNYKKKSFKLFIIIIL